MEPPQPVLQTLRDDSDDDQQGRSPSRSYSTGGLGGLASARRSNANLRTIRDDKGGGIKRVRSSDMLRMQIDMMQSESEEKDKKMEADKQKLEDEKKKVVADKAKADADLADQKRRHDADKDYLRSRINELRKQVAEAEKAKAMSDAKLESSLTSAESQGTDSHQSGSSTEEEQRLQKQVDDGTAERKVMEKKIAAMQAEIDAAARRRYEAVQRAKQETREEISNESAASPVNNERIAELQKQLQDMTAAKKEADDAGKNLQEQLDQRAMADGAHQAAIGDATSKERRLRQKLRKLQEEMEVASYEKKVADEETQKQLKAEQDKNLEMEADRKATEEKMRNKLQALQHEMELAVEEKEAAVQAKVTAEEELQKAISDSASGASDYAEQTVTLQKQLEDLRAQKLVHDRAGAAKQRELQLELNQAQNKFKHDADAALEAKQQLEAQLAELQEAADEATYSKLANDDVRADLEQRLKALQEEVEQAHYEKHLANEELDRVKQDGSSGASHDSPETDELTAKLKAAEDKVARLMRDKEDHKALKNQFEMSHAIAQLEVAGDDLMVGRWSGYAETQGSNDSDKEIAELKQQLQKLKDAKKAVEDSAAAKERHMSRDAEAMADVLAGLEKELEDAREEKDAMKAKADLDYNAKIKAESDLTAAVSSDDKAAIDELKKMLSDVTDAKDLAESEFASLLQRSADGSTVDDRIALLRKELYDSRVAGMAQKKASGAKEAQLEERLQAIKEEMEVAVDAKVIAEKELIKARSETSGSMASDERSAELQKKLDEVEAAKKAHDDQAAARERKLEADVQKVKESRQARIDAGEVRERKLEDDLEALKEKLTMMQEEADEATYAKLEGDSDRKVAEDHLKRQLQEMKAEVDKAVFEKNQADSEVERLRGSSGSENSGSNSAEYEALASKLRESEERVAALRAQKKTIQDNADAKQKVDRDDRDALQAVLDSLKLQLDESKGGRKAEVDELQEKLQFLHRRVESAEHAQILAEKELDKVIEDSSSGSSSDDRLAMLQKQLYENRVTSKAQKDAGAVREKELADQLVSIKEEAEAAAKAFKDEFLAKEGDLLKRVKFLQEEMEAAMEAQFEAEKERDRARSQSDAESSSMSSSDAQTIASLQKKLEELQAMKKAAEEQAAGRERKLKADRKEDRDAGAAREAKMEAKMATLKAQLQALEEAADEAAFAKKTTAGEHKATMDAAGAREDELKKQLKEAVDQKHLADEKLERASSSDAASSTAEVTELEARLKKAEDEKKQFQDQAKQLQHEAKQFQEKAEEEKKWADESIERLQEELSLLQEQAAVLASGKRIAEEEIREMRSTSEAGKGMTTEVADALLVQQVEQLKAEQQLSYNIAETMYRRLDADNQALQEELEAMETQKKEVDDELLNVRENELRDVYDKLRDEQTKGSELQIQVGALEAKLKEAESSPSNQEDLNSMKEQVHKLLRDLEHMTAEKEAATKRLEWEKATKRELRQKIYGLQEHADAASTAKKTLEEELRALQDQPEIQTTESMEELAEKLKQQVQSLQEEKEETLRKMQALEHSVATGEYEVGDSARVREAYVNKLQSDIELLETSVKHLTDENQVLLGSKERLEGGMSKGEKAKFCALDDQIQSLNSQTKDLTEKLDTARKEADDAKIAQMEEKDQVLDLQYRMDKNILQLATLKSTTRMNMERIKKEHDEAVKSARESGAADVREELDKVQREREALKAALEAETQGRKEDEQLRADESTKNDAKDREIADLKRQNAALLKKVQQLGKAAEQTRQTEKLEEEKKDSFNTSDEFVRMKATFEKQVKELMEKNMKQTKKLREKNEALAMENKSKTTMIEGLQSQVREFSLAKQNGNKLHTVEERTVNGALGKEHEKKLEVLESENATLKSSMMESDLHMEGMRKEIMDLKNKEIHWEEEMCSERRKFEQQIQAMRSQVVERQNAGESGPGNGASSTDLVAADASCEDIDPASNSRGNLQQGALAALKASRDHLVARLSRNLHNERDSLARRAQALKLSAVAAERAVESAELTSAGPGSAARSMRDMAHSQEEFESLQSILNHFKSLYEMKDLALKETQIERDELIIELQKYQTRAIE